jgi:multidrug efflux pump
MTHIVDWFLARLRLTLSILTAVLVLGTFAYLSIPKESDPDIPIPLFVVQVIHPGISPEDAERLIIRPLETQLKTVEGLKQMNSTASQGYGALTLEFDVNFNKNLVRQKVQEKVDIARPELPQDSEEPQVIEINIADDPVISIVLSGPVPERALLRTAKRLERELESVPGVLSVDLSGQREEVLEIVVDQARLQNFGVSSGDLFRVVTANNQLIPAGNVDTGRGRFAVKVPGLVERPQDVLSLPVKVSGDTVVTLQDIADVRRTFLDRDRYLRFNGNPAIAVEVKKRVGENHHGRQSGRRQGPHANPRRRKDRLLVRLIELDLLATHASDECGAARDRPRHGRRCGRPRPALRPHRRLLDPRLVPDRHHVPLVRRLHDQHDDHDGHGHHGRPTRRQRDHRRRIRRSKDD